MTEKLYFTIVALVYAGVVLFWLIPAITALLRGAKQYVFDEEVKFEYRIYNFLLTDAKYCSHKEMSDFTAVILCACSLFGGIAWPVLLFLGVFSFVGYCVLRILRWTVRSGRAIKAIGDAAHEHVGEKINQVFVERPKF